jgi:MFS family permease
VHYLKRLCFNVRRMNQPRSLLRDRNFLIYLLGNVVSALGTWAQRIGIGWLSWDLTHQTWWVGVIALAQILPLMAFGPLFGAVMDRLDRRRYAMAVHLAVALIALALYFLTALGWMRIEVLLLLSLLTGLANSAYHASRLAMVNDVLDPKHVSKAIAINAVMFNVARAVGPAITGVIIAVSGIAAAFAVNAAAYASVILAVWVLKFRPRTVPQRSGGLMAESVAGVRYLLGHVEIRRALLMACTASILGRGIMELFPAFSDTFFQKGSVGLANLTTAVGAGAVAGALLQTQTQAESRRLRMVRDANVAVGVSTCLFGICTAYWAGLLVAVAMGFCVVICSVGQQVIVQSQVSDQYRGRVLGLWTAANIAGPGIGGAMVGAAAQVLGLRVVTVATGLLCIALVIWIDWDRPKF